MTDLPSGTVTFLFTDIEGSTERWERDRAAMAQVVERHLAILDAAIQSHGGVHFKTVGDAVQAAFPTAPQAVAAAIDGQKVLIAADWSAVDGLPVRMALHAGEAEPDGRGDYLAAPLNRLSRLLATAHGGQILLSQTVQQLIRGALRDGVTLRDLGEHRLRDLLEPERIFQLLHPSLPSQFPELETLANRPHNLPIQLTPLSGRKKEVAALQRLIIQHGVRLLTLTGPGGTGKTRLALAVAAEVLDEFPDGVWFVDLAPLRDQGLVVSSIARNLGLRESATQSVQDALSTFLATKRLLLVLDNFEHLLEAAPIVSDLLQVGPGIVVLVTSREPLHLRGERDYALAPLALPDSHHHLSRTDLVQNPAVALFVHHAQAARADFVLTDENAADVAAICTRLDGLPLAIELAAARSKVLPPAALLPRLEARLPLLTGGPRDAPTRQRTLRDTVAWSHDLLTEQERLLFRRLGVFVGGWTVVAAEAIANGDGHLEVFDGLTSLVDKSLVRQIDQVEGEPRFTMLETIREFALEQLGQDPQEAQSLQQDHAAFFADLALAARMDINVGVLKTIRRLGAEEDNFRTMLTQLLATGDAETTLCVLGGTLVDYWNVAGGQFGEARTWLDRAFAISAAVSPTARAWGFNGLTVVSLAQRDFALARTAATHCRDLAAVASDPELMARGALSLSLVEHEEGHEDAAVQHAKEAADAARAADDSGTLGWSLVMLGAAQWSAGNANVQTAISSLEEALALFRELGGIWGEVTALVCLADVARTEGNLERAARLHADALRVRRHAGVPGDAFVNLVAIAEIAQAKGHLEPAARLLGADDTYRMVFGAAGWGTTPGRREQTRRALMQKLGDERFAQAWEAGRLLPIEQAITEALALADELVSAAGSAARS